MTKKSKRYHTEEQYESSSHPYHLIHDPLHREEHDTVLQFSLRTSRTTRRWERGQRTGPCLTRLWNSQFTCQCVPSARMLPDSSYIMQAILRSATVQELRPSILDQMMLTAARAPGKEIDQQAMLFQNANAKPAHSRPQRYHERECGIHSIGGFSNLSVLTETTLFSSFPTQAMRESSAKLSARNGLVFTISRETLALEACFVKIASAQLIYYQSHTEDVFEESVTKAGYRSFSSFEILDLVDHAQMTRLSSNPVHLMVIWKTRATP